MGVQMVYREYGTHRPVATSRRNQQGDDTLNLFSVILTQPSREMTRPSRDGQNGEKEEGEKEEGEREEGEKEEGEKEEGEKEEKKEGTLNSHL